MAAYQIRWQRVNAALAEFHGLALEAEALWGSPAALKTTEVVVLANELHRATQRWVNRSEQRLDGTATEQVLGIVSELDADGYRDFTERFGVALAGVEDLAKHHLNV